MSELSHADTSTLRPNYTFEQLEAALEIAPTEALDDIHPDFAHVGTMMVDREHNYQIFTNKAGVFVKALVSREIQ